MYTPSPHSITLACLSTNSRISIVIWTEQTTARKKHTVTSRAKGTASIIDGRKNNDEKKNEKKIGL